MRSGVVHTPTYRMGVSQPHPKSKGLRASEWVGVGQALGKSGFTLLMRQGPGLEFKQIPEWESRNLVLSDLGRLLWEEHPTHARCSPPESTMPLQARSGAVAGKRHTTGTQRQPKPPINFMA